MYENKNTIIIADDHKLFSHSLELMINGHTPHAVIKKVNNGRALIHALNDVMPELIILDINMPDMDGLEALARIKAINPKIKLLVVSYLKDIRIIKKVRELGAEGYFVKDDDPSLFLDVLEQVMNGHYVFPGSKSQTSAANTPVNPLTKYQFTDREIDILKLIGQNHSTSEIAAILFISENTVNTHRKNICNKLNTSDPKIVYSFAVENF
jgi:DNA-binding NarL/FixJ family response regulator